MVLFGLSSNSEGLKRPISRLKAIKPLLHWLGIVLAYFFISMDLGFCVIYQNNSSHHIFITDYQKLFLGALYTLHLAPKNNVIKCPQFTDVIWLGKIQQHALECLTEIWANCHKIKWVSWSLSINLNSLIDSVFRKSKFH